MSVTSPPSRAFLFSCTGDVRRTSFPTSHVIYGQPKSRNKSNNYTRSIRCAVERSLRRNYPYNEVFLTYRAYAVRTQSVYGARHSQWSDRYMKYFQRSRAFRHKSVRLRCCRPWLALEQNLGHLKCLAANVLLFKGTCQSAWNRASAQQTCTLRGSLACIGCRAAKLGGAGSIPGHISIGAKCTEHPCTPISVPVEEPRVVEISRHWAQTTQYAAKSSNDVLSFQPWFENDAAVIEADWSNFLLQLGRTSLLSLRFRPHKPRVTAAIRIWQCDEPLLY